MVSQLTSVLAPSIEASSQPTSFGQPLWTFCRLSPVALRVSANPTFLSVSLLRPRATTTRAERSSKGQVSQGGHIHAGYLVPYLSLDLCTAKRCYPVVALFHNL